MRRVLLGTPCFDGRPDAWYMHSVIQTIKVCAVRGIEIVPILMSYDAMVQRARNDLVKLALERGFDDLLFIDADEEWDPLWALALIEHDVDVVGGAVRKKTDDAELYNVRAASPFIPVERRTGLWLVDGIGTGFLRLSKRALQALWESAEPYRDNGSECRMVFNVAIVNGDLVSEDTFMCNTLKAAGFNIYLDPSFTVTHIGPKKFKGDFLTWVTLLQRASKPKSVA